MLNGKMKYILVAFLVGAMTLTACSGNSTPSEVEADNGGNDEATAHVQGEYVISYGHGFMPDTPQDRAAIRFKEMVEAESEGRIVVNVFASGQLGSAREMFESLQLGSQEIALLPTARISGFSPTLQIFDLPFLFPNREVAYKVFDGAAGEKLMQTLEPNGVKGLAIYEDGFKHFTSNERIETVEDFDGLKFRTMESPIIMEQFKAVDSNPVAIAFSELYNSLQNGTVEGQENPLVTIHSMKFYEVQDYLLYSEHAYLGHIFLVGKGWYEGLPSDLQEVISKNAKEIAGWERALVQEEEKNYLDVIVASGTEVIQLSDVEKEKMKARMGTVYDIAGDTIDQELIDMVVDAVNENM